MSEYKILSYYNILYSIGKMRYYYFSIQSLDSNLLMEETGWCIPLQCNFAFLTTCGI